MFNFGHSETYSTPWITDSIKEEVSIAYYCVKNPLSFLSARGPRATHRLRCVLHYVWNDSSYKLLLRCLNSCHVNAHNING